MAEFVLNGGPYDGAVIDLPEPAYLDIYISGPVDAAMVYYGPRRTDPALDWQEPWQEPPSGATRYRVHPHYPQGVHAYLAGALLKLFA